MPAPTAPSCLIQARGRGKLQRKQVGLLHKGGQHERLVGGQRRVGRGGRWLGALMEGLAAAVQQCVGALVCGIGI
eukprot:1141619-Pelagomonas_calceolata.AAC.1